MRFVIPAGVSSSRMRLYASLLALMAGLNLWYWWPAEPLPAVGGDVPPSSARSGTNVNDFQPHQWSGVKWSSKHSGRNLFEPVSGGKKTKTAGIAERKRKERERKSALRKAEKIAALRLAEQQRAQSDRAAKKAVPPVPEAKPVKMKLVGVLMSQDPARAYILFDNQAKIVLEGDTFASHYLVEKITLEAIQIKDIRNQSFQYVPLSGK